ncbi:hypothetical protein SAMN05660226_02592 [Parapedobacter luteus]|uniref:Uncharacterized protein n=1 Tax=Parapedobacter luteus TaxID=623280 RepID=A0A1T5D8L3_9SPHI|nr:hypothetical protein SAMN05660226_02592 [Parapedobacter luteus]
MLAMYAMPSIQLSQLLEDTYLIIKTRMSHDGTGNDENVVITKLT